MTIAKAKKGIATTLIACVLTLACVSTAFASNSTDTHFTFNFSGGKPQVTEFRSKTDATNVYMSVEGVENEFVAHVVGADDNVNPNPSLGTDCSHNYTYTIRQPGVVRMRNWVYDGAHRFKYAAIYAAPSYGFEFGAWGLWSPDSV